jgi:ABC-type branched-subunit amino acid transport system ATPase component
MLEVRGIDVLYGDVQALWDVSFTVDAGEVVTLIGANGAGKSTVLKSLSGLLKPRKGQILLDGKDVAGLQPYDLVARGLVLIPEARQLWPAMTVAENLEMGAYASGARPRRAATLKKINEGGVTILLVEQNVPRALALAQRAYVLESGRVGLSGTSRELARDPRVREEYLGT